MDPKFYFHIKELSRITVMVAHHRADVLFVGPLKGLGLAFERLEVNASLNPVQQRHLEARFRAPSESKEGLKSL